jgi:uncharacterized membrane protein YoaK (UPF0700 family)
VIRSTRDMNRSRRGAAATAEGPRRRLAAIGRRLAAARGAARHELQRLQVSRNATILLLAVAAGGIDAVALRAFGALTAAQTGNTILLAVALGQGQPGTVLGPATSVVGYVAGAGLAERMLAGRWSDEDASLPRVRILAVELLLLVGVLIAWKWMGDHAGAAARVVLVALAAAAMGIQSVVVLHLHAGPTTTYVTGTLTTFTMGMIRGLRSSVPGPSTAAEPPWFYGVTWGVYLASAITAALLYLWSRAAALMLPIAVLAIVVLAARAGPATGAGGGARGAPA